MSRAKADVRHDNDIKSLGTEENTPIKAGVDMTTAGSEKHRKLVGIKHKTADIKNPWLRPAPSYYPDEVGEIQSVSVDDRLSELKFFDSSKLMAVIRWPSTQKTVRAKAKIFLKRRGINVDKSGG